MKSRLFVAGLLALAACGSPDAPGTATAPAPATPAARENADPRIAQIRDLHQQLLAIQKPLEESEKNPLTAKDKAMPERHREYTELVATSQTLMGTINQLDPDKSDDATQTQLVGEALQQQQAIVNRANTLVERNREYARWAQKTDKFLDSVKRAPAKKAFNLR